MGDDENEKDDEYDKALASLFSDEPITSQDEPITSQDEGDDKPQTTPRLLSIDEVAQRTDLSKPTLRFYEKLGLVEPPARPPGKFRKYGPQDVERLEHVKQLRDLLGLSLTEIEETLRIDKEREQLAELMRAQWQSTADTRVKKDWLDEARRLNQRQLDDANQQLLVVEEKMQGLAMMRAEIEARLAQIRDAIRQLDETRRSLDEVK
jgi:DNA-binding transcriptional MerR regulator